MSAAPNIEISPPPDEQRMLLRGVSWKDYVLLRDLLDGPSPRMTYRKGALELMSPSTDHEMWKKNIARLVELYAHLVGLDLYGYGSTTFKKEAAERGCEPDECYVVGKELVDVPELVLEVIHTNPLLDKLDVYAGLGVPEVWVFKNGVFTVYVRSEGGYGVAPRSARLPALDLDLVARFAVRRDLPQALRELEAIVRAK